MRPEHNTRHYDTGVLHPEIHDRLVAEISNCASDARIDPDWISTPLGEVAPEPVVKWTKAYRRHAQAGVTGLALMTTDAAEAAKIVPAIAGALIRNFIRARVFGVEALLEEIAANGPPDAACLLIPNFFLGKSQGGTLPSWKLGTLFEVLADRSANKQQTVVCVTNLPMLTAEYGPALGSLIEANYAKIKV